MGPENLPPLEEGDFWMQLKTTERATDCKAAAALKLFAARTIKGRAKPQSGPMGPMLSLG